MKHQASILQSPFESMNETSQIDLKKQLITT